MGLHKIEEDLLKDVRPDMERAGVTLLDVEARPGNGLQLRFIIDAEGGVSVDDCVRVDRLVEALLEENDEMPEKYSVEVTSPGLERELRRREEYDHFRGRLIRIITSGEENAYREYRGVLEGTDGGEVLLKIEDETVRVSLEEVTKAKLLFES